MSLSKCLKKIAINGADKKAINAIAEDLYTDGMTEEEIKIAENLAVEQYLSTVDKDLDDIATRAESMGGKVSKFDDSGELAQFAGELADNAPVKKLQQAKLMKDKGQSTEVIRRETGWFKGVDNKWRYEISDDAAEFKIQINTIKEKIKFKASELIDHPILFDAYQDIKDTVIIFDPDLELGSKGMYSPKNDSITLATGLTEQETMSILLHEIQHAIQEREEFARGGSADENFVSSIKHALKGLKTGKETDVKSWEWKNEWKIGEAKTAAMVALDGLMYKSATKLMEYANHPTPSSVFRHVRNEVQWLYHDRFQQDRATRDEVNEIQRMFYDIPKRGPKRNEKIAQIAYKTAQLLRENIGSNSLRRFKNDERTLNGMIKALERESDKKRKELEPLQELKKEASSARRVEDKTKFKTPYRVYEALAGEIEARTTQARQNLTADERRDRSVLQDMDVHPDEAIVIMGGNEILAPSSMMSQQLKQPDRASFKPKGINPNLENSIIKLSKASDLSSFLHESAHLFLDMEGRFATEELTADQQTILDFLGLDSFNNLIIDGEITAKQREAHEKWAETFEVYLREGKAPSSDLREAFAAFKSWLIQIYKTLRDPRLARADLTPEIKEVFDRLLASEVEIEQMKANPAYDQLFKNKEQAGMTDQQWEAYQKQVEKAHNRSQQNLDDKLIKELMSRKTKEWKAEKKPLIAEELERLSDEPVYRLIDSLKDMPMDIALVREALGIEPTKKGEKKSQIEKFIGKYSKKEGVDPHDYQNEYGFNSIEHMFQSLIDAKPIKKAANENAEQQMIDKHGDILNDGSIEQEVRESVHNDEQAKLALMELRALNRKGQKIDRATLKANAKELISTMKFSEIQPSKYYQAEIKHAKQSVSDKENAEMHKIQQLANHYLYKEAVEVKAKMVKQRKYVRGLQDKTYSKNVVDPSYAQNIRMLATAYNMKQGEAGKRVSVESIINWMVTQVEDENNFIDFDIYDPTLIEIITDRQLGIQVDYELPAFDDMTAGELNGLSDQLKHMRFLGGRLAGETKDVLINERQKAADSIIENGGKPKPTKLEQNKWHRTMESVSKFFYSHRRLGGIFQTLDGFSTKGPMSEQYDLINKATNKELDLTASISKSMDEAFKDVLDVISSRRFTTIVKGDGQKFKLSNRARFVLGLNWGNQGNKDAVLAGLNEKFDDDYTEADIVKMLSTMSDKEILALDKVWKAKEPLWPEMSGVEVRLKGVAPSKIEAMPIVINGIQLDGGHYRLHYRTDPSDSVRTKVTTEKAFGDKIKISTASSLNERVGSGGRLVDLELSNLFQDLAEDIHYISYAELADSMNGIFKGVNNPVVESITKHYGQPYYDNLVESLSAITQPAEPATGIWQFMKYVRTNLTYAYLAFSIRNVVQQPIAITNTFAQLGLGYTFRGVFDYYRQPIINKEKIKKDSAFMNNRTSLVNREAREQLSKIDAIHPKLGAMKNMAFTPQTFMDSLIAYPTWMGAQAKFANENPEATEAEINAYADEMVAKTIGSGLAKDVGSILNKSEAEKQITFMGTFFNLTWNLHVENAQLLKRGKISGMEYARRLGWMAVAPAILTMLLLDDVPEDDEDKIAHALKEVGAYNMSSLFLLRDLASTMKGFTPSIPGLKIFEGGVRVSKEMKGLITGDEELDAETVASILRGLQPIVPLPGTGQAARMLEGGADPKQGVWGTLVEGKERNK